MGSRRRTSGAGIPACHDRLPACPAQVLSTPGRRGCPPHLLLAVARVGIFAAPAQAHKLILFANAEGSTIRGKAYFPGGSPAQGLSVTAFGPQGAELARTTTDEQGEFTLDARYRCDHRLVVETPDGHGAEFTLRAAQLPAHLPPRGEAAGSPPPESPKHPPPVEPLEAPTSGNAAAELRALRADMASLQEQLTRFENQTRLRDVLGGIGYILGLGGIAFYFLGIRRKKAADSQKP